MRILKLPLAGLLFCVMALFAGCKTSNEPKAPVALTWEMGAYKGKRELIFDY